MEKISVIGIGKLGLCFALTLEKAGFEVLGVDINQDYVNLINSKKFCSQEPGVNEMLNVCSNFTATTDLNHSISFSDTIYVVVATPSLPNGEYNHTQVENLITNLKELGPQKSTKQLVICCTTMPEYCDQIQDRVGHLNYEVSYNPEFIAQGTILRDQRIPDMVLIGESNKSSGDIIQRHYELMTENTPTICRMSRTEAEICKISLNCFLTTKISFANMVGDICNASGCNPDIVLKAVGSDSRISSKYLGFGFGFGGPCFPRDNRALGHYALKKGIDPLVCKATDEMNKKHLVNQFNHFIEKNNINEPIVFDYVTYKRDSTMLEESQQLQFAVMLAKYGYDVTIKERGVVIEEIKHCYGNLFKYLIRGATK
jgi:nucleotide sugar dehydrogenase